MKVGVLALQGASARHSTMLSRLGVEPVPCRLPSDLDDVDALVLPGGESTTMSMLLESSGLFEPMADRLAAGMPAFGTCAGMILLGREILDGRDDQRGFDAIDIAVRRNAFGRQVDSFESDLDVAGLGGDPVHAVFIRAPVVEAVGDEVEVLARVDGRPVLCRQGHVLVAAFHPELGGDPRLHELFVRGCVERRSPARAAGGAEGTRRSPSAPAPEAPRADNQVVSVSAAQPPRSNRRDRSKQPFDEVV